MRIARAVHRSRRAGIPMEFRHLGTRWRLDHLFDSRFYHHLLGAYSLEVLHGSSGSPRPV